jgi:iron complex transport system ATP-binding protein
MSALPRPNPAAAGSAPLSTVADPALPAAAGAATLAIKLEGVCVAAPPPRPPRLRDVSLAVAQGEHWGVLGANGSGKSTLLEVVSGRLQPSAGTVTILGEAHGAVGFRDPGLRIGVVDGAVPRLSRGLTALDVVLLRRGGPAALMGTAIKDEEVAHARGLLGQLGCDELIDRAYIECSQGQRQRINLARALLREPAILLLDEPTTALDLPGRAAFLEAMAGVAQDRPRLTTVTVTHHVEELPPSTTHVALLRAGRLVGAGRAGEVMIDALLSECFGVQVSVDAHGAGWTARVRGASW